MSIFMKCLRHVTYPNYRRSLIISTAIRLPKCNRNVHFAPSLFVKMYKEHENDYAYNILENKGYAISFNINNESQCLTEEQFTNMLQKDWSSNSAAEVFKAFSLISVYCSKHNMCISNQVFDNYIDTLTDSIKLATDEELKTLFYSLNRLPDPPSIRIRNYIEIWVALDEECVKRCKNWSHDELLCFTCLFYMVNVIRYSDFTYKSLNKLATKAKQLTPGQLVQTLFLIGIKRKSPFDIHNLEIHLNNIYSEFSIDDLAIMSMGFFKSKTPIRDSDLILKIVDSVISNAKTIHEVSLAALLKLIRYSTKMTLDDRINRLLETLQYEVPRLSVMCNVHLAILGTTTMNFHKECLTRIAETVINKLTQTRMKDLERLVLTFATFNFIPETQDCFFTRVLEELRKPERNEEINGHGRSFACCIAYFSILRIYPEDLISKVLSSEFLERTYGKTYYNYGKEILILHHIADLYCRNVVCNHLSNKAAKTLAKKYTDFVPTEEYKKQYNITERMFLDVMKVLRECRGGNQYVVADHILPYHQRGDIIICNDHNGKPVNIQDAFLENEFGFIRKPPNDLVWTALVIAGRNALIYGTDTPTGYYISKIEDLKQLGYNAVLVPWSIYSEIKTVHEKAVYLNNLIKCCTKNK